MTAGIHGVFRGSKFFSNAGVGKINKNLNIKYQSLFLAGWIFMIIVASVVDYGSMPGSVKTVVQFKRGYVVHFGAYFFASFLTWLSFRAHGSVIFVLHSAIVFLGIFLEFIQRYIPSRTFNKIDILMNLSGIICCNLIVFCIWGINKKGG